MTSDNLAFYKMGAEVPKEAQKEFNNGRFKGTDINRMWRIKTLTEMFGPAGIGWDFQLTDIQEKQIPGSDTVVLFAKGELTVKDPETGEWSKPIVGYGGNFLVQSFSSGTRVNDDAYKMVETDAFGTACSKLGIGASVYWANDKSKYTKESEEPAPAKPSAKRETKVDPFFGPKRTTAGEVSPSTNAASQSAPSTSASPSTPSDKDIMNTILKARQDPRMKNMILEWESKNNVGYIYETTPEQRMELYGMIRSVA